MIVLEHGYIKLIEIWGNELKIAKTAGVSYQNDIPDIERVIKQIIKHPGFGTPFEHVGMTIKVKAPIFVLRQWMRQRHLNYNEQSARYTKIAPDFYAPNTANFAVYKNTAKQAYVKYLELLEKGESKEQARMILPVNIFSEIYISGNLRAWLHFLTLRQDKHAQWEIRQYANVVHTILKEYFPYTIKEFDK